MPWYFYALIGISINATSDLFRRIALSGKRKIDYFDVAFLMSLVIFVTLSIHVSFVGFVMPPLQDFWLIFVINILMGVVSWLTNQKGLSLLGLSEYSIILTSRQIVTWILSVVLLGIGLTMVQGIGLLLVSSGIVIVFLHKNAFKNHSGAGIFYTGITALMWGAAILTDQVIYRQSDPASYMVIGFGTMALLLLAIKPAAIKSVRYLKMYHSGPTMLLAGSLNAAGLIFIFTSLKLADNAPLVSGVFQLQIIVSVLLATIFLNERKHLGKKLVGAALATAGAILIVI